MQVDVRWRIDPRYPLPFGERGTRRVAVGGEGRLNAYWQAITTDPRRRLYLIIGAGIVLLLLTWWLTQPAEEAVAPPAPIAAAPPPAPVAATPTPPAPSAPAATPEGLRLFGLTGSGAIIGLPDGSQRLVRIGREVMPGLTLAEVRQHNALLRSAADEFQLDFQGVAAAPGQPAAAAPQATAAASEAQIREETLRYRLGLEPHRAAGRIAGFTIRPGANLPALERAGLRAGDRILSVNGSVLDEERMLELAWTIANSDRTEFEFERGGRRSRAAIGRN